VDTSNEIAMAYQTPKECDSDCVFCRYQHNKFGVESQEIDFEKINFYRSLNIGNTIMLCGGEPFISEQFLNLIEYCHNEGLKLAYFTNGIHLDMVGQERLEKTFSCTISLLSNKREVYERLRLDGSFDKCMDNVKQISKFNIKHKALLTIMNSVTIGHLYDFCQFAKDWGYYPTLVVQDHIYADWCDSKQAKPDMIWLHDVDLDLFKNELDRISADFPDYMNTIWAEKIITFYRTLKETDYHFWDRRCEVEEPICRLTFVVIHDYKWLSCLVWTTGAGSIEELKKRVSECRNFCSIKDGTCSLHPCPGGLHFI